MLIHNDVDDERTLEEEEKMEEEGDIEGELSELEKVLFKEISSFHNIVIVSCFNNTTVCFDVVKSDEKIMQHLQ